MTVPQPHTASVRNPQSTPPNPNRNPRVGTHYGIMTTMADEDHTATPPQIAAERLRELAATRRAVTTARRRLRAARAAERAARATEPAAIRAAHNAGLSQVTIAELLERSCEHIRVTMRQAASKPTPDG